ncbi:efflux RND transporter permease subunit [Denitrobaculum tricleocarpae]|nr:MMPL family transporter [Denitrobaculum tricleocarpae]
MNPQHWERLGRSFAEASIRLRWLVIALSVALSIGIGYGASTLQFAGDYRVFFGPDNPDFVANERAQATFGKPDNVVFVIIPDDGEVFTSDTLRAVHALTEAAWTGIPYVSRVDSLTNFQNTQGDGDNLIVEDLVFDPTTLSETSLAEVRRAAMQEPLVNGFVVSPGADATLVNAVVQLPSEIPNMASQANSVARDIRDRIEAEFPGHTIHITGVASLSAAFEEAGVADSSTLIPAVYGLILVVMLVALRSLSAVLASLLLILLSTFVGMGVGGLAGVELTPISLAAPTIILTIAVADAIHVIAGVRGEMRRKASRRDAIIQSLGLNFLPIGITSLTTVIGFLTLNFSDSPPFHHLGNMTAAGIAAAWLLSITFLPALLSVLPMSFRQATGSDGRTGTMTRVASGVISAPRAFLGALAVGSAAAIAYTPTIEINDQWSKYFDQSLEFRQAIDASDPYFGSDTVEFILDPGAPGEVVDPEFLAVVDAFAAWLREQPSDVAHVFALSDIMKRLNRNLNGDDPAFYRLPEDQALASQYLLVYELSLPYGLGLNDRVDIDRQSTRVTASMRDISTGETRDFVSKAEAWFAANGRGYGLEVTGPKVLFAFVADRNIQAAADGAIYLIIAILVILTVAFRSLSVGLLSVIANVLPILTAFGIWALLVGVVGFSIAAVGAVAVGLVVDFTVHFLSKYDHRRHAEGGSVVDAVRYAFDTAGQAIVLTTVILASGFAILATSTFKLNADMGLLTAISIVLAMLVNLLLVPAILLIAGQRIQSVESHTTAS